MCPSGWAASWAPIPASRTLIWAASMPAVAVRAAVMTASAAPSSPVTPSGAARSRAHSTLAGAVLPRPGIVFSQAAMACSSRPAAASWLPKLARNRKLIGLARPKNSPAAAGNATARWARSWLHAATRCAIKSRRARTAARSARVAGASGTSGRSRARSVRSVSASTNASNRSSLPPPDRYRARRFFTRRELTTTTVRPAASSAPTSTPPPRSIATSATPVPRSRVISSRCRPCHERR